MTVAELIKQLSLIKDKTLSVKIYDCGIANYINVRQIDILLRPIHIGWANKCIEAFVKLS